jgi:acyl-CoA synthetase (NDP forming)
MHTYASNDCGVKALGTLWRALAKLGYDDSIFARGTQKRVDPWRLTMEDVSRLGVFFNPKSVAVVGASSDPKKPGNTALKNLVSMGYKGKVFPINPREDTILGFQCYKNLLDIPDPVEVCVFLVSAELTMEVAKELAKRKSRFNDVLGAICMSAGFGELNTVEAKQREKELIQTMRRASIRLIGPNCLGIIDAYSGFNTNFDIPTYPKGGMSIVTQSGAFANSFLFWAEELRMTGLSKFASIGNMADVSMSELLMLWKNDESTRVIGVYMEGLPDPRKFFEVAHEVSAVKPIVVLKSGKSKIGATAALSHTGAVAGSDAIYDGAFKQAGMLRAGSVPEFYNSLRAFEKQPLPDGNRVCVLSHMGGPGTICIDEISATPSLQMAKFSPETHKALKSVCAPMANIGKPDGYIDLTAAHFEKLHNQVLQLLFQDDSVDLVMQIVAPSAFIDQKLIVDEIVKAYETQKGAKKPFLNAVTFGQFALETRKGLEDAGLPTMEYPDSLAKVAGHMATYAAFRKSAGVLAREREAANAESRRINQRAKRIIASAADEGRLSLLESEAYQVCAQYGIQAPPFQLVDSIEEAVAFANRMGYPIVLKALSAETLQKTDAGGMILEISSDGELVQSYKEFTENIRDPVPGIQLPKVLVQKLMPPTTELVLEGTRDKSFGPVVMFGLGGIHIEATKILGFRLAPLTSLEAKELILDTLPSVLVKGAHGRAATNVDSIADFLVSLGRLLVEQSGVEQATLNRVLAYDHACMVAEARIIIGGRTSA